MTNQELETLAGPDIVQPRPGLYKVCRTSAYNEKPCDEAYPARVLRIDVRNVDDPAKLPIYGGGGENWYKTGTNHRVVDGNIVRDLGPTIEWIAEIPDILAFVEKHGQCVINTGSDGWATIEIYDDYRE